MVMIGLCAVMALPATGQAQAPVPAQVQTQTAPPAQAPPPKPRTRTAPPSTVSVDGSEAMFTTICALLAAGFESNVSADNWTAFRAQMRERLRRQQGPAVEAVREFTGSTSYAIPERPFHGICGLAWCPALLLPFSRSCGAMSCRRKS
jgi:hypothetical protein